MVLFRKSFLAVIVCIVAGLLLLVIANLIPARLMSEECQESTNTFIEEGMYPKEVYSQRTLDSFTDIWMLLITAYPGEEPSLEKAICAYSQHVEGEELSESFFELFTNQTEKPVITNAYERYWHGYQISLKPLLTTLNYQQIRKLNAFVLYGLMFAVSWGFLKKQQACLFPFLIMMLFAAPTAIVNSLQFSSVFYITFFVLLIMLWCPDRCLNPKHIWWVFLFSGIATAYLDFLTAPTLSLTIPLCMECAVLSGQSGWKGNIKTLLLCVIAWFFGYAGMWAGKWLIAWFFQGKEFTDSLIYSIRFRSAADGDGNVGIDLGTRFSALKTNWWYLSINPQLVFLTLGYVGVTGALAIRKIRILGQRFFSDMILFVIPLGMPILWIFVLSNHSSVHFWFTYRTLIPIVFCLLYPLTKGAMLQACSQLSESR